MSEEQAVARTDTPDRMIQFGDAGMELHTLQEAYRFAQYVLKANMAPKGDNEAAIVVKMAAAMSLRIDPIWGLANLTFTNGKIGIMGDAACAVIRSRGLAEGVFPVVEYEGKEGTQEWKCCVGAKRVGHDEIVWREFSIADAENAGLVKLDAKNGYQSRSREGWGKHGPWATYPKRMLYYRALGFLVRDVFSDALMGCAMAEELADFPSPVGRDERRERDVTPPKTPDPLLAATASRGGTPQPAPEPAEGPVDDLPPAAAGAEPCAHPDGFAEMEGFDEPICIHCEAPMPDSYEGAAQERML